MKISDINRQFANFNSFRKISALGIISILVSACGGTGQDDGQVSQFDQSFSGLAIDGNVARATVYMDTNNDGVRNAWEPFAFTDNEGYYSYNPNTDTNYCAADASAEEAQYCLRTKTYRSDVVIRIQDGYDIVTGEPFVGQMSRRLSNIERTNVEDTLVSPISSLLTDVEDSNDQGAILNSLGLNQTDLNVNYLNTDGNGGVNKTILNAAIKVHKVVSTLSDRITDTYDEIGETQGVPKDASNSTYKYLANEIVSGGQTLDTVLSNQNTLANVLDNVENDMRAIYEREELDLPADMGSASSPENFTRVINVASRISEVVNSVLNPEGEGNNNSGEASGSLRTVEAFVIKSLNETGTDSTIETAANFFTEPNNADLVSSLIQSMSGNDADIIALSDNDFEGDDFDSVEEIQQATRLPQDAMPFTQIGGLQIRVSDLDLGTANDLNDAEIEWYFQGNENAVSGAFSACVKYIEGADSEGNLGDGNTKGELVDGFWSLLGSTSDNIESYSLLLTINYLNDTYQAIMKPAGSQVIDETQYQKLRFDFDGDVGAWHSENGLSLIDGDIPSSDEECKARLPSRIGLD